MTFIKTDVSGAIGTHAAVTTNVHGTGAGNDVASDADITTHAAVTTNVHGTGAGNDVASDANITTHAAVTTNVHGTGAGNVIVGNDELSTPISNNYSGNNTANRAIAHGLGVIPKYVIIINATTKAYMILDGDFKLMSASSFAYKGVTSPDNTNFYVGEASSYTNSANATGEAYKWMAIP